jgi:hypothetical protein
MWEKGKLSRNFEKAMHQINENLLFCLFPHSHPHAKVAAQADQEAGAAAA